MSRLSLSQSPAPTSRCSSERVNYEKPFYSHEYTGHKLNEDESTVKIRCRAETFKFP